MSLKAKIEAVIYAAEEPVTLVQLAGLLGQEAQAELDHQHSPQRSLSLNETEADLEAAAASDPTLDPDFTTPAPALSQPAESGEPAAALPTAQTAVPRAAAQQEKESARRLRDYFRSLIDQLIADYAQSSRGLEIREVAGGFRISTKPEYHDAVRGFVKSLKPALKLTLQALETLAVVAYKQPVTSPEISEIRGVDSSGVLGSLMARKLITTAGRKPVIGRPILYKTTKDFLLRFGLKDISELPSIEEFEKMAGELADVDPVQQEIPMQHHAPESPDKFEPEKNTHEAQADGDSNATEAGNAAQASNVSEASNPTQASNANEAGNVSEVSNATEAGSTTEDTSLAAIDNRRAEDGDTTRTNDDGANIDEVSIDGRISGLPPNYDDAVDDPSAQEAAIQSRDNRDNPDAT